MTKHSLVALIAILSFMTLTAVTADQNGFNGPNGYNSCNAHNGCKDHNCCNDYNGCNDHNGNGCYEHDGCNSFLDKLNLSLRPGVLTIINFFYPTLNLLIFLPCQKWLKMQNWLHG